MVTGERRMSPPMSWMLLQIVVLAALATSALGMQSNWTHWGGDNNNRRFSNHSCIDFSVGGFKKKWSFFTGASVIGTPAVCGNAIFFNTADSPVRVFRLDTNGKQIWVRSANTIIPGQSVGIRSAPILSPDCKTVYWTTQWTKGSYVIALDAATGKTRYAKLFDNSHMSRITQSGVLWNGVIYIGASSMTEGAITSGTKFRGSMFALNAADGSVKWKKTVCPAGYTGCAIWGSSPSIDVRRNQVCVGTGNNYEVPKGVSQCVINAGGDFNKQRACLGATNAKANLVDAMVCFDLNNGNIKWARTMNGVDMYLPGGYMGPDEDYAQGPIIIHKGVLSQDVLIATSKSSRPVAFDPNTGATKWALNKLESGAYAQFGSCTNNKAYCVGLFWYNQKKGMVYCLDALTGKTISKYQAFDGGVYGPLTCTQKYVFIPKFDGPGSLVAMEIATGKVVGSFSTGATLFCGPAIVNGVAYVGSGYNANGGVSGKYLHAVSLPLKGKC